MKASGKSKVAEVDIILNDMYNYLRSCIAKLGGTLAVPHPLLAHAQAFQVVGNCRARSHVPQLCSL